MAKMIKCSQCGQSISQRAPTCPHCGHPNKQSEYLPGSHVFLGLLVAVGGIWFMWKKDEWFGAYDRGPTPAQAQAAAGPVLELKSWRCKSEHGYSEIVGEVKNISGTKLENVLAVGRFSTKAGELVTVEDTLIQFNPLMPGQTSPFSVLASPNPLISTCSVDFSDFSGRTLLWRDGKSKKR